MTSTDDLLRVLADQVIAQRAAIDDLHAAVQLGNAMIDELIGITRALADERGVRCPPPTGTPSGN